MDTKPDLKPDPKPEPKPVPKPEPKPKLDTKPDSKPTPELTNPFASRPGIRNSIKNKEFSHISLTKNNEDDYYLSKFVPPPSGLDRYQSFNSNASNASDDEVIPTSGKISNYCKKYYANHCRPQYSYPLTSINWKRCNMKNWYKPYSKKYLLYKKDCKTSKNKKAYSPNISVGAKVLHKKFPYIWRFLNKKTQKKIIKLAQLPVNMIDIWPNINNPVYIKKMKTIKQIINKN